MFRNIIHTVFSGYSDYKCSSNCFSRIRLTPIFQLDFKDIPLSVQDISLYCLHLHVHAYFHHYLQMRSVSVKNVARNCSTSVASSATEPEGLGWAEGSSKDLAVRKQSFYCIAFLTRFVPSLPCSSWVCLEWCSISNFRLKWSIICIIK